MAKKKNHGHVNHERYLVTYSDLITLLLAFFIILYAMSENNPEKMKAVELALQLAFNPQTQTIVSLQTDATKSAKDKRAQATQEEQKMMKSVAEQNDLRKLKEKIDKEIKQEGLQNSVHTQLDQDGLRIILTDEILFDSGSADFKKPSNLSILQFVSFLLGETINPVTIEGHTDNVPIATSQFPSNWELSAARSLTVLKYIVSQNPHLQPDRFSATGYGEYKPIASNKTEAGRKENRRVEILIQRIYKDGLLFPNQGGGNQ